MKKLLVIFLALTFVLAMISLAFGSRYNAPFWSTQPGSPGDPHGSYADTTDMCKDCHAVHLAQASYKLLRPGVTSADPCSYCHGSGGATTKIAILNTSGHGGNPDVNTVVAPDDVTPAYSASSNYPFNCATCHAVHGNNVVGGLTNAVNPGTTDRILKNDPDPNDNRAYYAAGTVVSLSVWCQNCHGANYGTYGQQKTVSEGASTTSAWGHDASSSGFSIMTKAAGGTVASVTSPGSATDGPRCNQCHSAGAGVAWVGGQVGQVQTGAVGSQTVNFPHSGYTGSYSLLKNSTNLSVGASGAFLDDVCNDCHYTPSLP